MTTNLQYRGTFFNANELHTEAQPVKPHGGTYRGATFEHADLVHPLQGKKVKIAYRGAQGEITL
ncbi:DUF4278 domain-containing protein [Phragmitibacter flavus]|uniref:DUF4278 domain-containing protein n=1 Tax=Phragmitibacter flavus TaxID=2576071 RepID=A0A5R8KG53_9BACT|nr:DUF4278 domain-containing protein [Phragmitibacter flavus]TLD71270.1 DUF4278 domain-containing protein [Phragmitibacter flavus]